MFDTNEEIRLNGSTIMPFHTNNVELSVYANNLFGINAYILSVGKEVAEKIFDHNIRKMNLDIVDLIVFALKNEIIFKRPDISQVYYPNQYDFFWFVSRNLNLLDSQKDLPFEEMEIAKVLLRNLLRGEGSQKIIE